MQIKVIENKHYRNILQNKLTRPTLYELKEYASNHNNLPSVGVLSRFIEKLEQGELIESDLPVSNLIAAIENFEQGNTNKPDLLIDFLCMLEDFEEVIKRSRCAEKIDKELRLLDKKQEELLQPSTLSLDFKEIPAANSGDGDQDTFEMFARDFLLVLGYEIEESPGRGADGGKDLIVSEPFEGVLSNTKKRWVVSCKHFAHSGKAVGTNHEINIPTRVTKFNADGFMAFYSTIPSSQLNNDFSSLKSKMLIEVLDGARIKQLLINDVKLEPIIAQYFEKTYKEKLINEKQLNFEKALLVIEYEKKKKLEEAARRLDAIQVVSAQRDYERKIELLKHQHDLTMSHLKES